MERLLGDLRKRWPGVGRERRGWTAKTPLPAVEGHRQFQLPFLVNKLPGTWGDNVQGGSFKLVVDPALGTEVGASVENQAGSPIHSEILEKWNCRR